jgi:hypothetical protein
MVDPVSVTIGVGGTVLIATAALGLYLAGRAPDHIINMRAVSSYYRHRSALKSLEDDVDDDGPDA